MFRGFGSRLRRASNEETTTSSEATPTTTPSKSAPTLSSYAGSSDPPAPVTPVNNENLRANNNNNNNNNDTMLIVPTPVQRMGRFAVAATQGWATAVAKGRDRHEQQLRQQQELKEQKEMELLLRSSTDALSNQAICQHALAKFDSCVDAADALAAGEGSGRTTPTTAAAKRDASVHMPGDENDPSKKVNSVPDCSVLVSPDGDVLLMPAHCDRRTLFAAPTTAAEQQKTFASNAAQAENTSSATDDASALKAQRKAMMDELFHSQKDDYESAVFLGHDLDPLGDKALNRFSAKGWSIPATTAALQQTEQTLQDWSHFCEQMVLAKKEAAARTAVACDALKSTQPNLGGRAPAISNQRIITPTSTTITEDDWESIDPPKTEWDPNISTRVGPFLAPDSSLNRAVVATEQYFAVLAESEASRWRQVSLQKGFLPKLRHTTVNVADRVRKRQLALDQTSQRARLMQDRLDKLKQWSERKWEAVYTAEERVSRRVEEIMQERSREREQRRMEELQRAEQQRALDAANNGNLGATNEEIWNIVSSVAETMESGSFEPMDDFPSAPLSPPRDNTTKDGDGKENAIRAKNEDKQSGDKKDSFGSGSETDSEVAALEAVMENKQSLFPIASREQIEHEMGLPELRAQAMAADDAVADAADALMGLLSSLDTTRRSARVAAETCLLSAGQAQAVCLKSLIQNERASLEDKLRRLKAVEDSLEIIDVRADLDSYITSDKKERGGLSQLGDDDDGGLASALAVLSSHVDGSMGSESSFSRMMSSSQDLSSGSDGSGAFEEATPDLLDEYVEKIFEADNKYFAPDAPESEERTSELTQFKNCIDVLCKTVSGMGSSARAKRSAICYALNSKRGMYAEIATPVQFDALCRLFHSILTGCGTESGNVSVAKMCIMLAQTFFLSQPSSNGAAEANSQDADSIGSATGSERSSRLYVKSKLKNHPLWTKDSFWDEALSQQITESLTHSGVMANFERQRETSESIRKSEWTQTRKTKWYDLSYKERNEAAAQVHAVVFAQLGALAHSMIEFGCGLERSCAFVRRMSIRNQLPSSQRTMLLLHLMDRDDVDRKEMSSTHSSSFSDQPAAAAKQPDQQPPNQDEQPVSVGGDDDLVVESLDDSAE